MQVNLNAVTISNKKQIHCQVFGHTSRGVPGIEIIGVGKSARLIKEKLIYFFKLHGLSFIPKRYVLCVEKENRLSIDDELEAMWLEVPLLLGLLTLCEHLPIGNLTDCLAAGMIDFEGQANHLELDGILVAQIEQRLILRGLRTVKYIGENVLNGSNAFLIDYRILIEEVLNQAKQKASPDIQIFSNG